jgi:hypothetical protein
VLVEDRNIVHHNILGLVFADRRVVDCIDRTVGHIVVEERVEEYLGFFFGHNMVTIFRQTLEEGYLELAALT